ncbi:MAG: erythronate-4-phosphate dehydrogenase [Tannerellaceae bacterium]|jgi:erythronate-4-phosphate dehydrogenase|nr:erythronate-4-phosphate dehydrogenase [Tannerellaceae bacterium]
MLIAADRTIPFLRGALDALGEDVRYFSADEFSAGKVKDADVLIVRSINKCTRKVLEGSRTKLITAASVGFDHIDTEYCDQAGIVWRNAPGSNARSVAEYVLACLTVLALRNGDRLDGKTVGIVGVGYVGKEVERLCEAIGMKVLLNDPPREDAEGAKGFVSPDTIAAEADVITFHTPLTRKGKYPTIHLVHNDFIEKLCRHPCLINAARGAVCDTDALITGRKRGKIGALVIDCWENEPHIAGELLTIADITTPHIAGFSADGKANAVRCCVEEISRFFNLPETRREEALRRIRLPHPFRPLIDMTDFPDRRIERAILTVFTPHTIDMSLRQDPSSFEALRSQYSHPREFSAYSILNATPEEALLLLRLGFSIP